MLRWVIATELGSDSTIGVFIDAVKRSGAEIIPVNMEEMLTPSYQPPIFDSKPTIFYGPVNFISRMERLGFYPGVFGTSETYSYGNMVDHIPHSMIFNNPSETFTGTSESIIEKIAETEEDYFFKPYLDNKSISGSVKSTADIKKFCELVMKGLIPDTAVDDKFVLAKPYGIESEYRLFVVDGEIITGSMYQPRYSPNIPSKVISFGKEVIKLWNPQPIFVLDIAVSMDNCFVMEVQNFHSAGFYDSDIDKLVGVINDKYQ